MGRRDGYFCDSAYLNKATYEQYVRRLTELSTSMFEWKNLPDTCNERFLEMTLFTDGAVDLGPYVIDNNVTL